MKNSEAKAQKVVALKDLGVGFFRVKGDSDKIFYRDGGDGRISVFPVLEDGSLRKTIVSIDSAQEVEVISQFELGIDRVYYS